HNRLQAADLILRITGIELAALDPLGVALLPQGEFALRFGHLFGKCDHRRVPLWEGERGARSRRSLSTFAPPAVVSPVAVPAAAVLTTVQFHLHVVLATPPLSLARCSVLGRRRRRRGVLLQYRHQPLEQAGFVGIA